MDNIARENDSKSRNLSGPEVGKRKIQILRVGRDESEGLGMRDLRGRGQKIDIGRRERQIKGCPAGSGHSCPPVHFRICHPFSNTAGQECPAPSAGAPFNHLNGKKQLSSFLSNWRNFT